MKVSELNINYIEDEKVDYVIDRKLRSILTKCFADEPKFRTQRYFNDKPKHRLYAEVGGKIIAHVAIHEKEFGVDNRKFGFLGIAEVCVDPEYRRLGLVKKLLEEAERINTELKYAILLGKSEIYSSSGYNTVDNIYFTRNPENAAKDSMVKCLGNASWPGDRVIIEGAPF